MRKRLILIQFSRALVPLLVMLFHVAGSMHEHWNYDLLHLTLLPLSGGVNYFFALSGFMLYYIYQNKFSNSHEIKGYLLNRFIRIYPMYWLLTLVTILTFLFLPYLGEVTYPAIIGSILLIPNPNESVPVLDVAWSLVYTAYFYLLFSIFFTPKKYIRIVFLFLFTFISCAFVFGFIWSESDHINFLFNEYNLIFLAGIGSASFVLHYRITIKLSIFLVVSGLIGFPLTWLNYLYHIVPLNFDIATGACSILIILGLASIDMQKSIMIPNLLNYLGNASFAIYLSHNLVLTVIAELFSNMNVFEALGGLLTTIMMMTVSTCVGCFIHSFMEQPMIRILKRKITM